MSVWTGSGNTLFVGNDIVDVVPLAETVTTCRDVLCSLLDPVVAHAQIFTSQCRFGRFHENKDRERLEPSGFVWIGCISASKNQNLLF